MQVITADKIGLLKYIQCRTKSSVIQQELHPHLSRTVNNMTWSGGYGGYEESEITLCRTNGLVESFEFYEKEESPYISDTCSLSFLSCNNCIYTRMLNHHHSIIYDDLFNKDKEKYKNYSNIMPLYTCAKIIKNGIYKDYLLNDRLLVTVSNSGHVNVLKWGNGDKFKYLLNNKDEIKYQNDKDKRIQVYLKNYKNDILDNIQFKQIDEKDSTNIIIRKNEYANINIEDICKEYHYNNMISKENIIQSYILSNPVDASCVNELLTNRLAIGGYKNCLKVFDLFSGTYLWKSRNLGISLLNINCETLIKSINFLNDINVNVLAAATYDQKIILYDMRCQNKPVYIYDHYKTKNVSKSKFNYFDHNYSESDLVFTSICNNPHIYTEEQYNSTMGVHVTTNVNKKNQDDNTIVANGQTTNLIQEETKNSSIINEVHNVEHFPSSAEGQIFAKFNIQELQSRNMKIFDNIRKGKEPLPKEEPAVGTVAAEAEVNAQVDTTLRNAKRRKTDTTLLNIDPKENLPNRLLTPLHIKKEENCKNYLIKKFAYRDSQNMFVSDNYGNVYKFEILTGDKLLNYIYMKKCSHENVAYEKEGDWEKKKDDYLIKNKEQLYKFYKEYQKNNKTHMRNDLPVMWAKDNFDQFLITFIKKFKIHNGAISSLSLHKGKNLLCSASYDRFISILNIEKGEIIKRVHVGHVLTSCLLHSKFILENEHQMEQEQHTEAAPSLYLTDSSIETCDYLGEYRRVNNGNSKMDTSVGSQSSNEEDEEEYAAYDDEDEEEEDEKNENEEEEDEEEEDEEEEDEEEEDEEE
ncbi:conserved Plasmodium protein, unknown function [Plasmodium malariae]|uniref:WD repeat-containing protein n=1 Tax=Plasmodium malariae TaxID=5858 RepID=A0A1D3JIQ4_PLAMA|nr:conserved Plasmodium protein, unknown function [Plasmodium malariae]SBT86361.1 conserved Plasmodium protein, unknown function [Plasmodium malariae]